MSSVIESKIASAEDLFQVRKSAKKLPRATGSKGYDSVDSPQLAELEQQYFRQRNLLLKEPRIVTQKQLHCGEWDEQRRLVQINEVGKFWAYMGFSNQYGKWLFPEEALFLMEMNTLEVRLHGCCLSHQEALQLFLTEGGLSMEEYTVYSQLRRNSYLVTRFHRDPEISFYAQSIGLDQYISKAKRQQRGRHTESDVTIETGAPPTKQARQNVDTPSNTSDREQLNNNMECSDSQQNLAASSRIPEDVDSERAQIEIDVREKKEAEILLEGMSQNCCSKGAESDEVESTSNACSESSSHKSNYQSGEQSLISPATQDSEKSSKTGLECDSSEDTPAVGQSESDPSEHSDNAFSRIASAWENCFPPRKENTAREQRAASSLSAWHLSQVFIPDMAGKDAVALRIPEASLLPPGVELNEELRDVCLYSRPEVTENRRDTEDLSRVQSLRFSYAEWMSRQDVRVIRAGSWREYKEKKAERERSATVHDSPTAHLWQGDITPLVHPTDATCLDNVFGKMKIRSFDMREWIAKRAKSENGSSVRISFNVYPPNSEFRKSRPGRPDHRVVVSRMTGQLPSLWERAEAARLSADGVPVHWAFLDSGSVSYFKISPTSLPSVY